MEAESKEYDRIIMGVDPGTNIMGYALLGIRGRKPQMIAIGVIQLSRFESHYTRLRRIYDRVLSLVDEFLPDELSIEAPFFGKNVQSMLKLGRAQGVAMAAALARDVPITEYEPRKIKMAITGNGGASKEQVREMLRRILAIPPRSWRSRSMPLTHWQPPYAIIMRAPSPRQPAGALPHGPSSWPPTPTG